MTIRINRMEKSVDGTFGVLMLDTSVVCLTLERPWLDNKKSVSCIPPNVYVCKRVDSPRWKDTFEILNVPGRTDILFHIGNRIKDSTGCVLLGSSYGKLKGERAILSSSKAFINFMERMKGIDTFPLQIINL